MRCTSEPGPASFGTKRENAISMTQLKNMSDRIGGEMQRLDDLADRGKSLANDAKSFAKDAVGAAGNKLDAARDSAGEAAKEVKSFAKDAVSTAKDKLGAARDAGSDMTEDVASLAKDGVGAARGKLDAARKAVTEAASHAVDTAGRVSRQAGDGVMKGADVVANLVRERPLLALSAAFAAGVATLALATRPWRSPSSRLSDLLLDFLETNVSDRARRLAKSFPSLN